MSEEKDIVEWLLAFDREPPTREQAASEITRLRGEVATERVKHTFIIERNDEQVSELQRLRGEVERLENDKAEEAWRAKQYYGPILKERDDWIVELIRERDEARSLLNLQGE